MRRTVAFPSGTHASQRTRHREEQLHYTHYTARLDQRTNPSNHVMPHAPCTRRTNSPSNASIPAHDGTHKRAEPLVLLSRTRRMAPSVKPVPAPVLDPRAHRTYSGLRARSRSFAGCGRLGLCGRRWGTERLDGGVRAGRDDEVHKHCTRTHAPHAHEHHGAMRHAKHAKQDAHAMEL